MNLLNCPPETWILSLPKRNLVRHSVRSTQGYHASEPCGYGERLSSYCIRLQKAAVEAVPGEENRSRSDVLSV